MTALVPVVLCGGSGTRLWPLSRTHYPKQFLRLVDDHSLLQNTFLRLEGLPGLGKAVAVANEEHRFLLAEQLKEIGAEAGILLEPVARNTAPAVACAAAFIRNQMPEGDETVMLVLPSDHVIGDVKAFHDAVMAGLPHARDGRLVTFGIVPTRAETGYGYIKRDGAVDDGYVIERFVEKPDANTAASYIASGEYFWNSGMFLFTAGTYLSALERSHSLMVGATRKSVELARIDLDFIRLDKEAFAGSTSESIDYAVMEKATNGVVIPLNAGWNDIGAWDALAQSHALDEAGNVLRGDVLASDTRNSTLLSGSRFLAAIGIDDLVVVETQDAVLVAHKTRAQEVRRVVDHLKMQSREEADIHCRVHRPWGGYEGLAQGDRYQVKRIVVKPGASLSLQLHHHRAEHWVVVRGTARITRGEETLTLTENQSTYIPLGEKHRLENLGKIPLELIEIQSGAYLGEDDIVRFEDIYSRLTPGA